MIEQAQDSVRPHDGTSVDPCAIVVPSVMPS